MASVFVPDLLSGGEFHEDTALALVEVQYLLHVPVPVHHMKFFNKGFTVTKS